MIAVAPQNNGSDTKTRIELLTEEVSASRLKLFLSCRLAFFYRYVAQVQKAPTVALHVGKTLHGVLQSWNSARWRGDHSFKDKLREVFDQRWLEEQQDQVVDFDGKEDKEREVAFNLLELYLKETPIPEDEKPQAVEVWLEADLSAKGLPVLRGVLDLVRGGSNKRIVDFKSAKQALDPERVAHQNELQLSCYSVLYRQATDSVEAGFEIHSLIKSVKTPKLIVTPLPATTQVQHDRLYRAIDAYVEGVSRREWVPSAGIQCSSCQYFAECRRWS